MRKPHKKIFTFALYRECHKVAETDGKSMPEAKKNVAKKGFQYLREERGLIYNHLECL